MLKKLHGLRVSQKLMLISVIFMIPDTVLMLLFLFSINANIRFARLETFGNQYQRSLAAVFELLPGHYLAVRAGRAEQIDTSGHDGLALETRLDQAFATLQETDARLGSELQFTTEGLAKRKREHLRVENVQAEWEELKQAERTLPVEQLQERYNHLLADLRTMITHTGDNSNLILDPDLDSYYLMDVTLLALPQFQQRVWEVMLHGEAILNRGALDNEGRSQSAAFAALLREADIDRVIASAETALNEDPNFYGSSTTLGGIRGPLEEFTASARAFVTMIERMASSTELNVRAEDFLAAGMKARAASFALWKVAAGELDGLLATRIDYYRGRRARSLILSALALAAAISFVGFVTSSISRPLQRQTEQLRQSNRALQAQVAERERAEAALRQAEEKYRSIFENSVEGIFQTTVAGRYISANPALARMYGYANVTELESAVTDIGASLYVDPSRREAFREQIEAFGVVRQFESQARRKDGAVIWISEDARAVRDASGAVTCYEGAVQDITLRKRQEEELEKAHRDLLEASRIAGMAEVATGVLHNVGNVLNSVNVAAGVVTETLRASKLPSVAKLAGLIQEQRHDLGTFFSNDPRGQRIPQYLTDLSGHLATEQATVLNRMEQMRKHLEHIKQIVAMQQNYAKVAGVDEKVNVSELVEDALRLNANALSRHQVEVVRQYTSPIIVTVDKHKVLQILVNLIANAKFACATSERAEKRITVSVANGAGRVKIGVADNGIGIPAENLVRIFNHGFTTRKDGHGFGLHHGALAAKQLGGDLQVQSDGCGQGATFTLELPA